MSALYAVRLNLPSSLDSQNIVDFETLFSELLDSAATSHRRSETGEWKIAALFEFVPDHSVIEMMLAPLFQRANIANVPIEVAAVPPRDWLAENRAAFPPLHIDRFWIYGSHVMRKNPAASLPLLIDAAQAFGSGTHPTTSGCLRAMQMIKRRQSNQPARVGHFRHVLDMGCGSAILAMAAVRLWPQANVVAADNDPVAVRVAAKNRALNGIAPAKMRLAVSSGFGSNIVCSNAPYDLILANILAGPLRRMAPQLAPNIALDGWLVLSGILNHQAIAVEAAYRSQHLRAWRRLRYGDWTTLVMRRANVGLPTLWSGR